MTGLSLEVLLSYVILTRAAVVCGSVGLDGSNGSFTWLASGASAGTVEDCLRFPPYVIFMVWMNHSRLGGF